MAKGNKKSSRKSTTLSGGPAAAPRVASPKVSRPPQIRIEKDVDARPLTFGPDTYKWLGISFALVVIGLFLMAGSRGDNFNEFDPDVIYSFRKVTLAPIVILSGLGLAIYAILKK